MESVLLEYSPRMEGKNAEQKYCLIVAANVGNLNNESVTKKVRDTSDYGNYLFLDFLGSNGLVFF